MSAGLEDIKRAFRARARQCHPDLSHREEGRAEEFKRVQEAYHVLSSPVRRRAYDLARGFVSVWGEGFDRGDGFHDPTEPLSSRAVEPEVIEVSLSFEEALRGGHTHVSNGSGELVRVTIPKGCRRGTTVRVIGKGGGAEASAPRDLFVRFLVEPHSRFRREGDHLHIVEHISVMEAMLGTVRSIRNPYGRKIKITLPPGTQPGERLRLRGLGVQSKRGVGDLFVEIDVQVPKELTEEQREQLREAARTLGLL